MAYSRAKFTLWSIDRIVLTGVNRSTRRQTCRTVIMSTINPTWTEHFLKLRSDMFTARYEFATLQSTFLVLSYKISAQTLGFPKLLKMSS